MSPGEINGEHVANGAQNGAHANGTHANGHRSNSNHDQHEEASYQVARQQSDHKSHKKKKSFSIGSLMQLRTASERPLPVERGDGTYRPILKRPGLIEDLRSFSWGGKSLLFNFCAE